MVRCEVLEHGEQALLYCYDGTVKTVEGPQRVWLFMSKLKRLTRYSAKHDEYLRIVNRDGTVEHKVGPCDEFFNDLKHASIIVKSCYCLNANEAIIVYRKEKDDQATRNVIHGPNVYALNPNEWVHQFSWHGVDDVNKTQFIANKDKFEILNCGPSQFYYNVREVRTSDDALIRIKLMIFYELKDIEKLLIETKDSIGDFINCCCADAITFAADKTYMDFIDKCSKLNDLASYPKLVERAKTIGYEITKVVFRGYFASPKLQQMHDNSINTRTKLKLEYESEITLQQTEYNNLMNELQRLQSEQDLELKKLKDKNEIERSNIANKYKNELEEKKKRLEFTKNIAFANLEMKKENSERNFEYLKSLKGTLNVNLDDYLLATIKKANKSIQINQDSCTSANVHFHDNK